jgi:hypothetical protein
MADAAERALTAYFDSAAQAEQAAQALMRWDKAQEDIKLGAIGVLTKDAQGEVETKNLSARNTGKGAKVGLGLGALAAVLSGGLTLVPTALAGAAGGGWSGGERGPRRPSRPGESRSPARTRRAARRRAGCAGIALLTTPPAIFWTLLKSLGSSGQIVTSLPGRAAVG